MKMIFIVQMGFENCTAMRNISAYFSEVDANRAVEDMWRRKNLKVEGSEHLREVNRISIEELPILDVFGS